MMNKNRKPQSEFLVEGTINTISHVFFMAGKNSKFFFIEVKVTNTSENDIEEQNICTILARIKDLHSSLLNLQINRKTSILPNNKWYTFHQQ